MPDAKLDRRSIPSLPGPPPGKTEVVHWDDGLGLRVLDSGGRSFVTRYRIGSATRTVTLGRATPEGLKAARARAVELRAKARLGHDERAEIVARKAAASVKLLTLGELVERYLSDRIKSMRPRSFEEVDRHLSKHCKPLHPLPATQVNRAQIAAHLMTLKDRNGPVAANRSRSSLSALFAWGMQMGLVEANPTTATIKNDERSRERVLSEPELAEVWHAADGLGRYGKLVRLAILTAARRGELGGMTWAEVDRERALWVIPGDRVKNGREHRLPLADAALRVLDEVERAGPLVFGLSAPFATWSRSKAEIDAVILAARKLAASTSALPMPDWTLHDLRRSAATHMIEREIAEPHLVETILNHVDGHRSGVAGTYNRSRLEAPMRRALALWGSHVEALVAGGLPKVVPIGKGAA